MVWGLVVGIVELGQFVALWFSGLPRFLMLGSCGIWRWLVVAQCWLVGFRSLSVAEGLGSEVYSGIGF